MRRTSICFICPASCHFMDRTVGSEFIGGAELQQYHIACYLRDRGWDVSFIAHDHGQFRGYNRVMLDGIAYHRCVRPGLGIPRVRFLHPQLTSMWAALKAADCSIYYQRCANYTTGLGALFCCVHHRSFVYAGASDTNFTPRNLRLNAIYDRISYRYGLSHAQKIIVQSMTQKASLKKNFGRGGVLIPNSLPAGSLRHSDPTPKDYLLWVGGIRRVKRPELFIELAGAFPDRRFVMVSGGAHDEKSYMDPVLQTARRVPNLSLIEYVDNSEMQRLYRSAVALVNTSQYEGFPVTFLEAWREGTPTISFVDPDSVIETNRLGFAVNTFSEMCDAIERLPYELDQMTVRCLEYFQRHHLLENVGLQYERLFNQLHATGYSRAR